MVERENCLRTTMPNKKTLYIMKKNSESGAAPVLVAAPAINRNLKNFYQLNNCHVKHDSCVYKMMASN